LIGPRPLPAGSPPEIFIRKAPPQPTAVFDSYWKFAAERQAVFHARAQGKRGPWTNDPVLQEYKFTNAYRAADRVSQYLIRNVIYAGVQDWPSTLLRILLFKIFNKIETWKLIAAKLGEITSENFRADRIDEILTDALTRGISIYSGAYIMPSGPHEIRQARKHMMHLALLTNIVRSGLANQLRAANSMERAYKLLLDIPSFGPFLAFQFLIDANYSSFLNFSEMEFVMPGPGARDGIRKCFSNLGDYDEADVIRWVADRQDIEFVTRGLDFQNLWGRPLQLIDCQNLFCEVDKYARVVHPDARGFTGRTRIKQRFTPTSTPLSPWFPPKWGLNEKIAQTYAAPGPSRE
jgi:hypothetical protein